MSYCFILRYDITTLLMTFEIQCSMYSDVGVVGRLGGSITIMPSHCVCDYVNVCFLKRRITAN